MGNHVFISRTFGLLIRFHKDIRSRGPLRRSPRSPVAAASLLPFIYEEVSERTSSMIPLIGKLVRNPLHQTPTREILADPSGELPMPYMHRTMAGVVIRIARVDDDAAMRGREQGSHVIFKRLIFNQVIDDVQRQCEIGLLSAVTVHQPKRLSGI